MNLVLILFLWIQMWPTCRGFYLTRGRLSRGPRMWKSAIRAGSSASSSSSLGLDSSRVPEEALRTIRDEILSPLLPNLEGKVAVVLGVSGGCDSVALLHALAKLREHRNCNEFRHKWVFKPCEKVECSLTVVHFNHQQRGAESDKDGTFVEELCFQYGVPFRAFLWNTTCSADFSQENAREWRRNTMKECLKEMTEELGFSTGLMFTAHHKDDSDESLLLKILRGVHLTNLQGMKVLKEDTNHEGTKFFWARPFLNLRKLEIVEFLEDEGLGWREDISNHENKYLRNRIRNELIPLLHDMISQDALQRRLEGVQTQSLQLKHHVSHSVKAYLHRHTATVENKTVLLIGQNLYEDNSGAAETGALHAWITTQLPHFQLRSERLQALVTQLSKYGSKKQWRINIGENWDVVRNGDVLQLCSTNISGDPRSPMKSTSATPVECFPEDPGAMDGYKVITVSLAVAEVDKFQFILTTSATFGKHPFFPLWRPPLRLREFLRGQKVRLHERDIVPIICLGERIVAVSLPHKQKQWEISKLFHPGEDENASLAQVWLKLPNSPPPASTDSSTGSC